MLNIKKNAVRSPLLIWCAGVLFVLFQLFLQLSSGVVMSAIMQEMHFSALTVGVLGGSLYIVYTSLQIPVGIMFDRKNTRNLMAINTLLCSLGCLLFAASHSLCGLFIGRSLIGIGAAFAFVGLSHILREHFPLKKFAFMIGLSETLAFIMTVIGMVGMGKLLSWWGWRGFMCSMGLIGLMIATACWQFIPNRASLRHPASNYGQQILQIVKNSQAWINGIFVGLCFTTITVFGGLWAIPFIEVKLTCTLSQATLLGALLFLGAGISFPLIAQLSIFFTRRKPLILASCLATMAMLLAVLYVPTQNHLILGTLMFMIGLCCGSYMLAYTIANELAPRNALSTCTGFTNTLAVFTAVLLQPFTGYLLDTFNQTGVYRLIDYQIALLPLPVSLGLAAFLVFFLPEKKVGKINNPID